MARLASVKKQSRETWLNLHSRLRSNSFSYHNMFSEDVGNFFHDTALSLSVCDGYVFDSLLTATGFLMSEVDSRVKYTNFESKTNLYMLFCGPPSTGKSQAINGCCVDPLNDYAAAQEKKSYIIGKTTSAGLLQRLSEGGTILVSSEIGDILNRMIKNDNESGSGDLSLLCQLFSGEQVSVNYASQGNRDIKGGTAFCILGAIQPRPIALLLAALDTGNGLIERFLIHFPDCLRPSLRDTRDASRRLRQGPNNKAMPTISTIIDSIGKLHSSAGTVYGFDNDAMEVLDQVNEDFIQAVNSSIVDMSPPPQSKIFDLVIRVAPILHVLEKVTSQLLRGEEPTRPTTTITKATLDNSIKFVEYCESQKETFLHELRNITEDTAVPPVVQPKEVDVRESVLRSPGPVITYRVYKNSCNKTMRSVNQEEYEKAVSQLPMFGETTEHTMRGCGVKIRVFVKKNPDEIDWSQPLPIVRSEYVRCFQKKQHNYITKRMQDTLVDAGVCTPNMFR